MIKDPADLAARSETARPGSATIRARIRRHRATVGSGLFLSSTFAYLAARFWPIAGAHINAGFFLTVATSSLTLFGLVFTLCLIGTQFMAARINLAISRIFGLGTWLYLVAFVLTIMWTLAVSYRAGEPRRGPRLCGNLYVARLCLSETLGGRIAIFGLMWSLLLLLPLGAALLG